MADLQIPFRGGLWGTLHGRDILVGVFKFVTGIGVLNQGLVAYELKGWHICDEPFDNADDDYGYQVRYNAAGGQGSYIFSRRDRINSILKNELDVIPDNADALTLQTSAFSPLAFNLSIEKYFELRPSADGQYLRMMAKWEP